MIIAVPVMADSKKGKLTVTVTDESDRALKGLGVVLYRVADEEKVMAGFKSAGLSFGEIMEETDNPKNSDILSDYVKGKDIDGEEKYTDSKGRAEFVSLEKGVYLVVCAEGEESIFDPFLCFVPTKIGNAYIYDIKSFPKVGDEGGGTMPEGPSKPVGPDKPSVPDGPDTPVIPGVTPTPENPDVPDTPEDPSSPAQTDKPIIPQTGTLKWPVWVLAAAGAVFIMLGIADIARKERDESE